jgi:hypothetical protein
MTQEEAMTHFAGYYDHFVAPMFDGIIGGGRSMPIALLSPKEHDAAAIVLNGGNSAVFEIAGVTFNLRKENGLLILEISK